MLSLAQHGLRFLLGFVAASSFPFCSVWGQAAPVVTTVALRVPSPEMLPAQLASNPSPAELFQTGKQALAAGQLATAEAAFRSVLTLDPKSAPAHVNLAVVYMRAKRWDDALGELRLAQALAPMEPGIQLNMGLVFYRKSDFAAAIKPLSSVLEKVPASSQARHLLGLCYFFTGSYQQAATLLAPLWAQEQNHLNYLYVLAIAASKSSNSTLQQQAFSQMLAIGQNSPEFHLYMGKAWLAQDDTSKALAEFQKAEDERADLPLVHYFLGRTYLEQHAYGLAETELKRDVLLEPDFAYDYEDLGILYAQLDEPAKAEQAFQQAVDRNRSLVNSYFGLAKVYRKEGKQAEALRSLDAAEALAPESASLHYLRGQVLASLGQTEEARAEFERSSTLLNAFNQRLQQAPTGDQTADAQNAAEQ